MELIFYRYKAIISFDGSSYYGYTKVNSRPTIESEICKALLLITKQDIKIFSCSRTDKGVHALGMVIHFDLSFIINCEKLLYSLNKVLPLDIRINHIDLVDNNFHSRYSAKSKIYEYLLSTTPLSAFNQRYFGYSNVFNFEKVLLAANLLIGKHDYRAFTPNLPKYQNQGSTIKEIYTISIQKEEYGYKIIIHANSFLQYMVRQIIAIFIEISKNKIDLNDVSLMLQSFKGGLRFKSVSPNGLYLSKIIY